MSNVDTRKKANEDSGGWKLLSDIENVNRALYLDKIRSRSSMSSITSNWSKSVGKPMLPEPKSKIKEDKKELVEKDKQSIWRWKGFRALTHALDRRFNCYFSVHVHSIEGLPPLFDDLSLVVHWKRRDVELETRPVMVCQGIAEFEERLVHSCSVYGRSGTNHAAKYEAKHFLLFASVYGTPEVDLGKQRIDLTRLLPLTLEELEEEKSSGKWSTSYRLSGEAKGGVLNVSFGYEVVGDNKTEEKNSGLHNFRQNSECRVLTQTEHTTIHRTCSMPTVSFISNQSAEDIKDLHEVFPVSKSELSNSISMLYRNIDELKLNTPPEIAKPEETKYISSIKVLDGDCDSKEADVSSKDLLWKELGSALASVPDLCMVQLDTEDVTVLSNAENHIELAPNYTSRKGKSLELEEAEEETKHISSVELLHCDCHFKEAEIVCSEESQTNELESALVSGPDLGEEGLDTEYGSVYSNTENHTELTPKYIAKKEKSLKLDDATETITSELLDLLGMDHSPFVLSSESDPESPRERLLRQFEKDALAGGFSLFGYNEEDQSELIFDTQMDSEEPKSQKTKAELLEDMEIEALMHEWDINEKAFQGPPQIPHHLPSIGQGLGPFVQTRNGEIICSMNPSLFKNHKNGRSLIMQVSCPVVMPAELGSGVMDILHNLAAMGIEKLSMQANKLMPLEDINGKMIQQIAWKEAAPTLYGPERDTTFLLQESGSGQVTYDKISTTKAKPSDFKYDKFQSNSIGFERDSEYVSLEDLAPLSMHKIDALVIEGLKIQSDMSDGINPQFIGEFSGFTGLEGAGGLQLLDIKRNGDDDVDGLMGLSLSLDEWMRLDSGEIYDEGVIGERTSRLLAAHHAKSTDLIQGRLKGEKRRFKGSNFKVALMVQLRDPLQDYEPVGAPMLALIQVERVFITPKPKIYGSVSRDADKDEDVDADKPLFKITEVHMAGLKIEASKSKLWGSTTQQQYWSRWMLANGMGKKNKHPFLKSKTDLKSTLPGSSTGGNAFWSVSSNSHLAGARHKEMCRLNSHIRNRDVTLRNETFTLQKCRFLGFI